MLKNCIYLCNFTVKGLGWADPDPLIFSSELIFFFFEYSNFDILVVFYVQFEFLLVYDENRTIGFALNDAEICKERVKLERVTRAMLSMSQQISIVSMLTEGLKHYLIQA